MVAPVVKIKQGTLEGKTSKNLDGNLFYSFQGIPYAQPPVGKLRFKAPQPPLPWSGTLDATKLGNDSLSLHMLELKIVGDEDCLYLNVYTPSLPSPKESLKPVMVWIHGGAFVFGSGNTDLYGPEYLLTEDIVLVTINYRLGLLGFINFENPNLGIQGNTGFKDQVMALRWVQENIKYFNGDPGNVTIFGESAGGASVHALMLSPMAKGLFHRAIAQSGCVLSPWSKGKPYTKELMDHFGLKTESELVEHLKKVPARKIIEAQLQLRDIICAPSTVRNSGWIVEKQTNEPAFFSKDPWDIMTSGEYNKVPFMTGYTDKEGYLVDLLIDMKLQAVQDTYDCNKSLLVPYQFNLSPGTPTHEAVKSKIEEFYKGPDGKFSPETCSDLCFLRGLNTMTKKQLETTSTPIYWYRFSLDSDLNIFKKIIRKDLPGACHADDVGYLFKTIASPALKAESKEYEYCKKIVKIWTTFALKGDPNGSLDVEWKPVEKDKFYVMDLNDNVRLLLNPEENRLKFLDSLLKIDVSLKNAHF